MIRKISGALFALALLAAPAHAADPRDMMNLSTVIVTGVTRRRISRTGR